jgi:hypothetical protein
MVIKQSLPSTDAHSSCLAFTPAREIAANRRAKNGREAVVSYRWSDVPDQFAGYLRSARSVPPSGRERLKPLGEDLDRPALGMVGRFQGAGVRATLDGGDPSPCI